MLIDPTTEAKVASVKLASGRSLSLRGALGAEVVTLEVPDGAGGWLALREGSEFVTLSADQMSLAAMGTILVRVHKPVTAAVVGVEVG